MFERFTEQARRVLFFARYEASQAGSTAIATEHLLLGLLREGSGHTGRIFEQASTVGGELVLENGQRLSFEIKDGATGALFSTTPVGDQRDTHPGLSSLPHVPGGV